MPLTSDERVARLWEVRTGKLLRTFGGDDRPVQRGAFWRDGARIVVGGGGIAEVWELKTGALVLTVTQSGYDSALDLSPDGEMLLIGSLSKAENVSSVWNVRTGNLAHTFEGGASAFFSPDGARVLTHTAPRAAETTRLWDVTSGELIRSFPEAAPVRAGGSPFSSDGQSIYIRSSSGLQVRDAQTGAVQRTINLRPEGDERFLALSPDARFVLEAAGEMGAARLRESESGAVLRIFDHGRENRISTRAFEVSGTFSPTGNLVATWLGSHSASRYPRLWDISDLTRPVVTVKRAGAAVELSWTAGELQWAGDLNGPWTPLVGARSPHRVEPLNRQQFYRARQE